MTRIAIVEDNKVIRESLMEFVQGDSESQCVYACATAGEALTEIPKHQPDMVLMDIQLPDISGIDCTARLKQLLPSVQIIMVTVYEDTERIFKALRAGACGYLLKRCSTEDLVSAIREVRQGGAPMSRDIARKVILSFQEPAAATVEVEGLSPREREILQLVAEGKTNKEVANTLTLSLYTVDTHRTHILQKLNLHSVPELILYAVRKGIIS